MLLKCDSIVLSFYVYFTYGHSGKDVTHVSLRN
jgi:hypothetical protein